MNMRTRSKANAGASQSLSKQRAIETDEGSDEVSETDEEEEPPTPRKPKRRPVREPVREPDPPSPRAQRVQLHVDAQTRRRDAHAERVQSFSSMLDKMVGLSLIPI